MPRPAPYAALAPRFAAGETSPSAELEARLARLDALDPELHAFIHVGREAARAQAAASDKRWRVKATLSPIDGLAIAIKDIIETEDMPTGQGSPIWQGFETKRDSASVQALREAGCIILGKTATTELAATEPITPACNPHDRGRTAGGSSAGSAASVGAGIVPAALGSQVVGSTLRPASYCGCVGFKPTYGALNRGGSYDHLTQSCVGVLAATPDDAWMVAIAISARVGGDPGHLPLRGPVTIPTAVQPRRLGLLRTAGWAAASDGAKAALAGAKKRLEKLGITTVSRTDDAKVEALEQAIIDVVPITMQIGDWEWLWPLGTYAKHPALSDKMRSRLASARTMTPDDYARALQRREDIRRRYAEIAADFDGFVLLGATGAAPVGLGWTGDPAMNVPASLLGVPAVSLPMLADDGMPLGLQVIGRAGEDAGLMATAGWLWQTYPAAD